MRRMKAATAYATLGYVGLLSCVGIISRFGRQARLGEHVDSGLTAYRHSEFATLDKTRQKHKTRLGRFITSPRRLAALRVYHHNLISHASLFGDRPRVAWGQGLRKLHFKWENWLIFANRVKMWGGSFCGISFFLVTPLAYLEFTHFLNAKVHFTQINKG